MNTAVIAAGVIPFLVAAQHRTCERLSMLIEIRVKPNARTGSLTQVDGGRWVAHLEAAPVDGKANAELIALIAERFGCRRSAVSIASGATGRIKRVRIDLDPA